MPAKSIREMTRLERAHYSLSTRVFRTSILGAVLLGLVALLIGLGLYTYALTTRYISDAFNLARSTATVANAVADATELSEDVVGVYKGLDEETRALAGAEEYNALFAEFETREDYLLLRQVLQGMHQSSDIEYLYLGYYDRDTQAIVYLVDADEDPDTFCRPGYWEKVNKRGLEKFLSWDGAGMLYDIDRTKDYGFMCTAGVPLKDGGAGEGVFLLADVTLTGVAKGMKNFVLQYSITMFVITNLFAILLSRYFHKKLVMPINSIADAAQRYVQDRKNGEGSDHFSNLDIHTGDEVENLSLTMADMERDLVDYEENLKQVTAEKERIGTELELATRIQADMLPNIFPAFPERGDFDVYASMTPAKEVGGDFYDFFLIDEDHLALVIADVSGKGIPAALFMMMSKIMMQNYTMTEKSPAKILQDVNEQICLNNREEMFVTVWLGILDLRTGLLTAANAGHEYPVMCKRGDSFEIIKDTHGFVIGGMEGMRYKEYTIQMPPGSKLFLYTDGVTEATSSENEMFGLQRLNDVLNAGSEGTPRQILENVQDAVEAFIGDADQFDDLTMLCLEYVGNSRK